jgi:tetratricopeptide (TPR) repeat protein
MKIERNSLCHCGSRKKYKKCCITSEHRPIEIVSVLSELQEVCDDALAKIEAGDLPSAELEAERLYDLYPDDHMVNFLQGVCLVQRERYDEAALFFEDAIHINPWFCEAYFNLASLYRQEMKTIESVACFRKIIEIEGEHGDLGKLAKKELDWFEKIIQKTSGETLEEYLQAKILFDEAFECLRWERYKEAISLFQQVLVLNPNHVQSYGNMALAHSALGEQKIALQYLDKALLLDPSYEPAQNNRENVLRLKEGVKSPFIMKETMYYKEKLESEGVKRKKPQALTWSSSHAGYIKQGLKRIGKFVEGIWGDEPKKIVSNNHKA